jgi:hypothetical protein
MIQPDRRLAWTAVIVCLAIGPSAAKAEPDVSKQRSAIRFQQEEHPDNPPAAITAEEDALARSPAGDVAFGPWVSVQVNVDSLGRNIVGDAANEPSLVINPINPNNMLIGWRQFNSITSNFRQAGWAYTMNGGVSWTFPGVLTPGIFRSDPVVGTDTIGNLFYQSLKGDFTLDLFKSTNSAVSWGAPVPSFGGDKNWLAIDRSGGVGTGNIYGIWQRFSETFGLNVFTRSTNGGLSFQSPVQVVFWPTFGTMDVGPDGTLYAAGIDGTTTQDVDTFVVSHSPNAQNPSQSPFFTGTQVALNGAMAFGGPNPDGLLGQAYVVTDKSAGPTRGYVYLLASVAPFDVADPLDVRLSRSTDGGITWSAPVRVNDDPSLDNYQWFGALAVAPDGRLDAVWYDSRNSGVANLSQLYYAYSYDAGATWSPNVAVSPSFDSTVGWPNQNKIGDYLGIVSDTVQAHVAYAATFNGEQDVYYLRVFPDCNHNGISDETDVAHGTSPDCDGNHVPDECQINQVDPLCGGGGTVPDGGSVAGIPLRVSRLPSGDVQLTWAASCSGADADYEVYEGTLGNFASHAPRLCTTSGSTTITLTPGGGNTYYLVVPRNGVLEGSYGKNSSGAERPQGSNACHPQVVRACAALR